MKNTLTKIAQFLKKHIIIVVIVAVVVAAIGVAIGIAVHKGNAQHKHAYVLEVVPPTCDHGGYILHTCSCGDFYKEDKEDPLEHEYGDWEVIQPATVDNEGLQEQRCLHCNKRNTETLPKVEEHEHTYEDKVVKATCTQNGYTAHTCTICKYKVTDNETDALGHSWSGWTVTKQATSSATGEKSRTCKTCSEVETETIPQITPSGHEHSYTSTVVAPTCTSKGYTRHTCSCGKAYTDTQVSALGHVYGDWKTTKQATTSATGEKQCVCTKCGHVLTETIPKLTPSTADKYESYIDPRVEIKTLPDGAMYYYYDPVCVVDTRSWGDPPTISITSDGGFYVVYYKQDGSKVTYTLAPVAGYANRMVIFENGSFETGLIGDFSD